MGLKYGYEGLNPGLLTSDEPTSLATSEKIDLNPAVVKDIHHFGGSILGTSRGPQDVNVMVDFLVSRKIDILFTIGGDGTQKGALAISEECLRRGLKISVIGVPYLYTF